MMDHVTRPTRPLGGINGLTKAQEEEASGALTLCPRWATPEGEGARAGAAAAVIATPSNCYLVTLVEF
jgi:hypothetical protein